jgi:hypothetical protein
MGGIFIFAGPYIILCGGLFIFSDIFMVGLKNGGFPIKFDGFSTLLGALSLEFRSYILPTGYILAIELDLYSLL